MAAILGGLLIALRAPLGDAAFALLSGEPPPAVPVGVWTTLLGALWIAAASRRRLAA